MVLGGGVAGSVPLTTEADPTKSTVSAVDSLNSVEVASYGRAAAHRGGSPIGSSQFSHTRTATGSTMSESFGWLPARHPGVGGAAGTTALTRIQSAYRTTRTARR